MVQKTIQDYYDQICEEYPNIPRQDIKRILQYGWKSLYLHNSYGGDTCIMRNGFFFYCGRLVNDSLKWFEYYKKKLSTKLRVLYNRKKIPWDGYYYFARTSNQYQQYLDQKKHRGRPRKYFTFDNVLLYKLYDECNINQNGSIAIFRISMPADFGFTLFKSKLITDKAELILLRESLKFQDILYSKYNFQFITNNIDKYHKPKSEKIDE